MMYPLGLDLADDKIPVAVTCRVLGFSKQAFYQWKAKPVSDRDYDDAHLINAAIDVHHDDPEFGYRFIADELAAHGYSIDTRMTSALAVTALRNAVTLRGRSAATIVHSDRGSQFRSHAYQRELRAAQLRGSIGRVGTCADNAAMESFFSLLQKNVLNRRRRQQGLGRLTPVEFETLSLCQPDGRAGQLACGVA